MITNVAVRPFSCGGLSVQPTQGGGAFVTGLSFAGGVIKLRAASGTIPTSGGPGGASAPFGALSVEGNALIGIFATGSAARNFASGAKISSGAGGVLTPDAKIVGAVFSGQPFGLFQSRK